MLLLSSLNIVLCLRGIDHKVMTYLFIYWDLRYDSDAIKVTTFAYLKNNNNLEICVSIVNSKQGIR